MFEGKTCKHRKTHESDNSKCDCCLTSEPSGAIMTARMGI